MTLAVELAGTLIASFPPPSSRLKYSSSSTSVSFSMLICAHGLLLTGLLLNLSATGSRLKSSNSIYCVIYQDRDKNPFEGRQYIYM